MIYIYIYIYMYIYILYIDTLFVRFVRHATVSLQKIMRSISSL